MKVSKRFLIIIIISIFVIALAALGTAHSQQISRKDDLAAKLDTAQLRLKGIQPEDASARQVELEKQLTQASSQLDAIKVLLKEPIKSVTITNRIYDLAKAQSLEIKTVTSSTPAEINLEKVPVSAMTFSIQATGGMNNLVAFTTDLNGLSMTGVVKSVKLTETLDKEVFSADIQFCVYSYEGK